MPLPFGLALCLRFRRQGPVPLPFDPAHCNCSPPMHLEPGARLGSYEVVGPLGAGGMGEAYRARDPRIGREVAIKVLPASFAENADRLQRFEREARAAGTLNHPNLVTIHELGSHEGSPYIVMELLEGETSPPPTTRRSSTGI